MIIQERGSSFAFPLSFLNLRNTLSRVFQLFPQPQICMDDSVIHAKGNDSVLSAESMSYNILVVEDYHETRELITEVLQGNTEYKVHSVNNGAEALKFYKSSTIDLVISDIKMPQMNGLDLMTELHKLNPDLAVILITGFGDDYGVKALEMGAEDCIFKPFNTNELLLRVARVLKYSKLRQLKELLELKNEQLRRMAITDALSQLFNRRYFLELLEEREFPRARRYKINLACIMIDIDHFKQVNDRYGHLQGDHVIRGMGSIIKEAIREIDIPARYGGEEFIILLPETDHKGTMAVAERLLHRTQTTNFQRGEKNGENGEVKITISIGISQFPAPDIVDSNDLINAADEALYRAKRAGRNRIVLTES